MDEYAVQVVNSSKQFDSFTAVDGVSFNVRAGEIFGARIRWMERGRLGN